jgi:hypothetical protein
LAASISGLLSLPSSALNRRGATKAAWLFVVTSYWLRAHHAFACTRRVALIVAIVSSRLEILDLCRTTDRERQMDNHEIHQHHEKAAHHHDQAAKHHREAAKYHKAGDHEKAAHHSNVAHGHHLHATEHHEHASKKHADKHG